MHAIRVHITLTAYIDNRIYRLVRRVCCPTPASDMRCTSTRGTGEGRVQGCQPPHSLGSNSRGIKFCEHGAQVSALANACRLARMHHPSLPFLRLAAHSCKWVARQLASSVLPQNASWHSSPRPITARTVRFHDLSKFISSGDALRGHGACLGHATSPGCSAWLA